MVSIITPSFNSIRFLAQTIDSILAQSYQDWELLIVDDFSTDNSIELIERYVRCDERIHLIKLKKNCGAAIARNLAIKAAKGRYIAFLDSDDLWYPYKLEKQIAFMTETGCPFSFGAYEKINEIGEVIGYVGVPERVAYHELLKTCVIGCLTAVYDTEYFGNVEMPLIRKRQDFGLWLRLLKKTEFAYGVQYPLGKYRVRLGSISSNKKNAIPSIWYLYREVEKLSFLKSSYYFLHFVVRGVLRAKFPKIAKYLGLLY